MEEKIKYYEVCWAKMDQHIQKMCDIICEMGSQKRDLYIHGIPRGGLTLAAALTHYIKRADYLHRLEKLKAIEYGKIDFKNSMVFVVDDVCDSGRTFSKYKRNYQEHIDEQGIELKFISIHKKLRSTFNPDAFLETLPSDYWIVYPWENINDINIDKEYMFI